MTRPSLGIIDHIFENTFLAGISSGSICHSYEP